LSNSATDFSVSQNWKQSHFHRIVKFGHRFFCQSKLENIHISIRFCFELAFGVNIKVVDN